MPEKARPNINIMTQFKNVKRTDHWRVLIKYLSLEGLRTKHHSRSGNENSGK
jgi:hypothetical protein